jgi:hypothetical protein
LHRILNSFPVFCKIIMSNTSNTLLCQLIAQMPAKQLLMGTAPIAIGAIALMASAPAQASPLYGKQASTPFQQPKTGGAFSNCNKSLKTVVKEVSAPKPVTTVSHTPSQPKPSHPAPMPPTTHHEIKDKFSSNPKPITPPAPIKVTPPKGVFSNCNKSIKNIIPNPTPKPVDPPKVAPKPQPSLEDKLTYLGVKPKPGGTSTVFNIGCNKKLKDIVPPPPPKPCVKPPKPCIKPKPPVGQPPKPPVVNEPPVVSQPPAPPVLEEPPIAQPPAPPVVIEEEPPVVTPEIPPVVFEEEPPMVFEEEPPMIEEPPTVEQPPAPPTVEEPPAPPTVEEPPVVVTNEPPVVELPPVVQPPSQPPTTPVPEGPSTKVPEPSTIVALSSIALAAALKRRRG